MNKLTLAAIVLWLVTIAVFGWFFVHGNTRSSADGRTAVVLAPLERDLILGEMRGLLGAVQGIMEGLEKNDNVRVAQAARAVGMASAVDVNPALMAKLPVEFKSLGMSVHHDMDDLAAAAEAGKTSQELLGSLGQTLSKCVACHASWQLQAAQ
jgi:cytochrome c556